MFYLFILICVLSQAYLYVSGSILGDLLRASGNVKYQLADVSDNVFDRIRDVFPPTVDTYGREGPGVGGRVDENLDYNINVPPANPYEFYRPFFPPGSVGGQIGIGASLPSASGAQWVPASETRTRILNVQQGSPPMFRYFED